MSIVAAARMPRGDRDHIGGKAKVLRELREIGFAVPDFVVSPTDADAVLRLLGTPLVVRSSASLEDGATTSFAGQFRSYLNLVSADEVRTAMAECYASMHAESVREYCRRVGRSMHDLEMHVIVQRMIEPELAGVAFSVNPVTGAEEVVIEACEGLADELLAGHRAGLPADHPLLRTHRPAIERLVLAIQRHFGSPQDVEFAVQKGVVYVLQSRPITRIEFAGLRGEWTTADFRDGGVSSRVCTPLMSSLYERVWDHALKSTLRELRLFARDFRASRVFFGRPYWNVGEVKRCVARLPGFCEREFDRDLSISPAYEGDGLCTPMTAGALLRAIPTLVATRRFFAQQEARTLRLLDGRLARRIDACEFSEATCEPVFHSVLDGDYLRLEAEYFRTIYAVSLAKMDLLGSFPQADDRSLVAALPPLSHMAPVHEVRQLPDRRKDMLRRIVRKYRHHCRLGLDICLPRWDEDEAFVVDMLRDLPAAADRDPAVRFELAFTEVRGRIPSWRRRGFEKKLRRLRRFVWLREEMRDLSNRMYHLLRRLALAIGKRRNLDDDIFMMTYREIAADDRSRIKCQRVMYEGYRNFRPPNEIGDRYRQQPSAIAGALQGVGASGGTARGRVFIARDVEEVSRMPVGDVLVCPFTDPGWTPVLDRAAAVVTETGGLLSHAAVICREYGIPAVLGVENATLRLRTGEEVVVWGDVGLVQTNSESCAGRSPK